MGGLIGSYIAFIIMELIVAVPVYYLLRVILKRRHIELVALIACFAGIGAGWTSGYRFTKDVMVTDYLTISKQNEIENYGTNLTKKKRSTLRYEFITDSNNIQSFHVGAAKASLPSAVFVAILLFWLAERQKRKNNKLSNT